MADPGSGRRRRNRLPRDFFLGKTAYDERTGFQTRERLLKPDDYGVKTDNKFGQADVREPNEKGT